MSSATQTGVGGENTPAFEAYRSGSAQTITDSTDTKIQFNSEIFDTAGAYDASTNYRFTVPSGQAGKYFVYSQIWMQDQYIYNISDMIVLNFKTISSSAEQHAVARVIGSLTIMAQH